MEFLILSHLEASIKNTNSAVSWPLKQQQKSERSRPGHVSVAFQSVCKLEHSKISNLSNIRRVNILKE
jgi:hypothetical protein